MTKKPSVFNDIANPIHTIWDGILLLPLYGVIDSKRAQDIMESMLEEILRTQSKVIILDILGVATVDSAVANHMIKITQATQLMGSDCIISGISPAIAQTLVGLGIDLGNVVTQATLKDALTRAFQMMALKVETQNN